MQPNASPLPARRSQPVALALLVLAGCAGTTDCGGSCGGAFVTKEADGGVVEWGLRQKIDNVASVRVTKAGFTFLNADHLNKLIKNLNDNVVPVKVPCTDLGTLVEICTLVDIKFSALVGDTNFNGVCDANEGANVKIVFRDVTWGMDTVNQQLRARVVAHIETDDVYVRTKEAHSTLCGGNSPILGRVYYNDELPSLTDKGTILDLDLKFSTAPDGRLEINFSDDSLLASIKNFNASAVNIDGFMGNEVCTVDGDCPSGWTCANAPAGGKRCLPPTTASYNGNGCSSGSGTFDPLLSRSADPLELRCGAVLRVINANCPADDPNQTGPCIIFQKVREFLLKTLKDQFAPQILALFRGQFDKIRCQQAEDLSHAPHDCNNLNFRCGNDDDGTPLHCDVARGVCLPQGVPDNDPQHRCEPIKLGITGRVDASALTDQVGFPPNSGLLLTVGLGGKTAASTIDSNGLQLSVMGGTAPTRDSNLISVCVPADQPPSSASPPALNFDTERPTTVPSGYHAGFSVAGNMLNRVFYDAYNAGLLCITLSNKTTPFIASGLFQTFLPSLGLLTQGHDVPMLILLRPSRKPYVRIGKNTLKQLPDGTYFPEDAIINVKFDQLALDFYALIDERQTRIFSLQTDVMLPLGLRAFPGNDADRLQPVLGDLGAVLTNITALNNKMLAEDPGVVRDLLGAAIRLAQPLLAGVLQPIELPSLLDLKFYVDGIIGAAPVSADIAADGYHHMAIYASVAECSVSNPCQRYSVDADARIVARNVPEMSEVRGSRTVPSVEIEASALQARKHGTAEFSYRVDGGLWSPWIGAQRFTIKDPIFLFQGRHAIEVTAREAGDDRTQDLDPVRLDFFVSFEAPSVELVQRADGTVVTKASSRAARAEQLLYSYQFGGRGGWTEPGAARTFTAGELMGRSLSVTVSDPAGRSAQARIGPDDALALASVGQAGCGTSSGGGAIALLVAGLALMLRRQRKGSSSAG